jgi:dolichyl-phosphate beta-glucosyltransferase
MPPPPLLSVVIPAFNEERRLPITLETLQKYLSRQTFPSDIWVVDNGSTDRTAELVEGYTRRFASIHLVRIAARGKGVAVRTGMLRCNGEYRFQCDADLSMPVEELNRFLPPILQDADVAIGSREAKGARRIGEPAFRHFTGRVFSLAVKLLVMRGFEDTQCGFKCFRAEIAQDLFSRQRFNGWSFDAEVLFLARKRGYRIREVPIPWYFHSDSRIRMVNDSLSMFADLVRIRWNDLRGLYDHPNPHAAAQP